jgi:hypothetical protein
MMPTMVMTPMVVPAVPMAEVADASRAKIGPDDVAAPVGIIIGRPVIGGPEKAPVVEEAPMPDCEPAVAKSAAMEHGAAAEAAAVKDMAAATAATEMHAMTTAAAVTVTASAAMAAAHFGDQSVGEGVCGWRRAWTDGGQRVRALARGGRQHEYRRCGETQATHKSAPRIWNLGHS